jgi:hypothetical protein
MRLTLSMPARNALARLPRPGIGRMVGRMLLLMGLQAGPSHAMDFFPGVTAEGTPFVTGEGLILPGDAARLAALLVPRPRLLVLRSAGGELAAGLALAAQVREAGLPVLVPAGGTCASACFLVLAAAPHRFAGPGARIGVHSAAAPLGGEDRDSLAATALMAREAERLGVPSAIVARIITAGPDRIVWLEPPDLTALGVRSLTTSAPPLLPSPPADGFTEGQRDRATWEAWAAGLPPDVRAGVRHWAGLGPRRPGASCAGEGEQFRLGCQQAGERGAMLEQRAAQDGAWRAGWDSAGGALGYVWDGSAASSRR